MTRDPYSFGHPETEPERDQRTEYRLAGRTTVTLELEAAEPDGGDDARVIRASSYDVSTGGMRLETNEPLPAGALLPARMELPGHGGGFPLTVEVIWCRPSETVGQWQSGLSVLDTADEGYLAWVEAMVRIMAVE
ncbi:PilZ domain-containing protein [Marinobacter sp.]|uniref:PilZ domain-containing protein n=1 Tax=Marinobacter sp. TaxID=50741 RepID=UPI0035666DA1